MSQLVELSPRNLPDAVKAGKTGLISSIETLDRLKRNGEYSGARFSNQWLSYAPKNTTFREANRKDDGKYHVSVDSTTGETHRIELPKTLIGLDGKELTVADAKNLAPSLALDGKLIIEVEFNPKIGEKGEFLYTVNNPSAWFGIAMPKADAWFNMVVGTNGVLKGFQKGDGIYFVRADGVNWNGLLADGDLDFNFFVRHGVGADLRPSDRLGVLGTGFGEQAPVGAQNGVAVEAAKPDLKALAAEATAAVAKIGDETIAQPIRNFIAAITSQ